MSALEIPPARLLCAAILIGFGCNFQFGYQAGMLNSAEALFRQKLNSTSNYTLTDESYPLIWTIVINIPNISGAMFIWLVPSYAERLGRKWAILLNNVGAMFSVLLLGEHATSENHGAVILIIARFVIGIHIAFCMSLQALYLTEISPVRLRGFIGSFQSLFIVMFVAFGSLIALPDVLGNDSGYMWMLILCALPSILQTLFLISCPESPKHILFTEKKENKARKSIGFFHGDVQLDEALAGIHDECETELSVNAPRLCGGLCLARYCGLPPTVKRAILIASLAMAAQIFTGIYTIETFSTKMFVEAGVDPRQAQLFTVYVLSTNVLTTIVAMYFIEKVPRRLLLIGSLVGCLLCNGVYFAFSLYGDNFPDSRSWSTYVAMSAYFAHVLCFSFGAGPIPWFLASEMMPQAYRSMAQAVSIATMYVAVVITGIAYIPLSASIGAYAMLVVYMVPSTVCILLLWVYMPETGGRKVADVMEDIRTKLLGTNADAVELELKEAKPKEETKEEVEAQRQQSRVSQQDAL